LTVFFLNLVQKLLQFLQVLFSIAFYWNATYFFSLNYKYLLILLIVLNIAICQLLVILVFGHLAQAADKVRQLEYVFLGWLF